MRNLENFHPKMYIDMTVEEYQTLIDKLTDHKYQVAIFDDFIYTIDGKAGDSKDQQNAALEIAHKMNNYFQAEISAIDMSGPFVTIEFSNNVPVIYANPGDILYDISYAANESGVSEFVVKTVHMSEDKISYVIVNTDDSTGPVDSIHNDDFGKTIFADYDEAYAARKNREKKGLA